MRSSRYVWPLVLLLFGLLAQSIYSRHIRAPILTQDSYQYLDAADHFLSGGEFSTSVVHFDEQVNWGRIPVPFTHFGLGYPLAISGLGRVGIPLATAGYLLSCFGYLLAIWLLWECCLALNLDFVTSALVCLLWTLNFSALEAGANVMTEALFTALFLTVITLMARDVRDPERSGPAVFLLLGAATGAAYVLRQAGLFFVPVVLLYMGWRSWGNRRVRPWAAAGGGILLVSAAVVIVRNISLTGSWNGGFTVGRASPWSLVLAEMAKAPYHLLLGSKTKVHFDFWMGLFLVAAAALVWMVWRNWRLGNAPSLSASGAGLAWIALITASYTGGVLLAALTTIASTVGRFLFPMLPVMLLAIGLVMYLAGKSGRVVAAVLAFSLMAINAESLALPHSIQQHELAAAALEEQVQPGVSMRQEMERLLPKNATLFATNGQAMYYLLRQPVVSVIESSGRKWDETDVRFLMHRFRAPYFVVFPGARPLLVPEQDATPFLHALTAGEAPGWLRIAARTPGVILYECGECVMATASK